MIVSNLMREEKVGFFKILKPIALINCLELQICWVAAVEFAPEVFSCLHTGGCVHDRYGKIKTNQTPFPTVVRVIRDADEKQFVLRQYQSIHEDGKGGDGWFGCAWIGSRWGQSLRPLLLLLLTVARHTGG